MKTIQITVEGIVQGVGFRYTTMMLAKKWHITGHVSNQADGSVYIVASGTDTNLNQFLTTIKNGPTSFSRVDHVFSQSVKEQHFNNFSIR